MFYKCSITRHTNKQGNTAHSKEQCKSLETNLKETETLELLDKDFKTAVLNMLNKIKENRDLGKQHMKQNQSIKKEY